MENRRTSSASNAPSLSSSMSNLKHSINSLATRDKMSPALKRALSLLKLADLAALENHFLATIAFLKPWSYFRDSFLLLQPGHAPRSSQPERVRAVDILWFYSHFNEGELRYDPRADDATPHFSADESQYGCFDTTHWGVEEYEKMLYAWLLQEFKVGKVRNPFGFEFFQCLNVCTAWRECLIPIVEAVRESYDPRGRRYYGRLARFLEERHPSRIAFPVGNVATPMSVSPQAVVPSYQKERAVTVGGRSTVGVPFTGSPPSIHRRTDQVTRKEQLKLEKELRSIEPKYGQLVEKPKWRPQEFFATQRARLKQKNQEIQDAKDNLFKRSRSGRESPMFGCKGVDDSAMFDPLYDEERRSGSAGNRSSLEVPPSPESVIKRGSKKGKTVVPVGMFGFATAKEKNPLNGVTRPLELSDGESEDEPQAMISHLAETALDGKDSSAPVKPPEPLFARPETQRKDSDGVYSTIRNSNPFMEDLLAIQATPQPKIPSKVVSPMNGPPSAIPKPLFNTTMRQARLPHYDGPSIIDNTSISSFNTDPESKFSRRPSYKGTGYDRPPGTSFIASKLGYDSSSGESSFALSEIPEIHTPQPPEHKDSLPTSIPWPGFTPALSPHPSAWPMQSPSIASPTHIAWPLPPTSTPSPHAADKPPVPPRNPARATSIRSSASSQSLPAPPSLPRLLGPRIVSKENIRGHLSNISRDISEESLEVVRKREASVTRLTPYNKNMFPRRQERKGTPVTGWMGGGRSEGVGVSGVEMVRLEGGEKE